MSAVLHGRACSCAECRQLDRRHPREGQQLAMFEGRDQRPPTEAEAIAELLALAGKAAAFERSGQGRML